MQRNTKAGKWRSLPSIKQVATANEKSESTINCIQRTMVGLLLLFAGIKILNYGSVHFMMKYRSVIPNFHI